MPAHKWFWSYETGEFTKGWIQKEKEEKGLAPRSSHQKVGDKNPWRARKEVVSEVGGKSEYSVLKAKWRTGHPGGGSEHCVKWRCWKQEKWKLRWTLGLNNMERSWSALTREVSVDESLVRFKEDGSKAFEYIKYKWSFKDFFCREGKNN